MTRWHPFRELRARRHITFAIDESASAAGGAFYARLGDRAAVVVEPGMTFAERQCALGHELIHDEWGVTDTVGAPAAWGAVVARHERRVDAELSRRMIPADELVSFIEIRSDVEPITAELVAAEFETTVAVAAGALDQLRSERRAS